jgi:hypothetical protein
VSVTELIPARILLPAHIAPVEYAVAVERYLASASLSDASRRIYRISLGSWLWPLVGQQAPAGRVRRGAVPPVVPLGVLDDPGTGARLAVAMGERAGLTDARTVNRELSALRSAAAWWQDLGWLSSDPTAGLRHPVFLTGRRAPARVTGRDVCPLTGRARMSYRRAAEIFTAHTAALDPSGRGWTPHQLRRS